MLFPKLAFFRKIFLPFAPRGCFLSMKSMNAPKYCLSDNLVTVLSLNPIDNNPAHS